MKTTKMSLANIQRKLSRAEMKNIMAGSGGSGNGCCCSHYTYNGMDWYTCGQTQGEAQASADSDAINYGNGHWCCDSCQISNPCVP